MKREAVGNGAKAAVNEVKNLMTTSECLPRDESDVQNENTANL